MIIRGPKILKGRVDAGLHYNLDLGPTLAELFGKKRRDTWDGQSYAKTLTAGKQCGRDSLVLGQCCHVCQRSVRFDDWLYMRTYHDGYHLFPNEMLFNIAKDPHEQRDVAKKYPDVVGRAVRFLTEWHDNMMATMKGDVDPLWTVMCEGGPLHAKGHLAKYCEYLKKTGRGWAVAELQKRHPFEFAATNSTNK
jgi:choline-sulfatase